MHGPSHLAANHVTNTHQAPQPHPAQHHQATATATATAMDSTAESNPPQSSDPAVGGPFAGDFWAGVNAYANQPSDTPFGIGWDHPVFRGTTHSHTHSPHQPAQELYTHNQQGWPQQNTLQQPVVGETQQQQYALPNQYRMTSFQQSTPSFESHQTTPSYQAYQFDPQSYYSDPSVSAHNSFEQAPSPNLQRVNQQQGIQPNVLETHHQATYLTPADLQPGLQNGTPVGFSNDFPRHPQNFHSTIDPQFLTAPQQAQSGVYSINPADLERPQTVKPGRLQHMGSFPPGIPGGHNLQLSNGAVFSNGLQRVVPKIAKATKPKKKEPAAKKVQTTLKKDMKPLAAKRGSQGGDISSSDSDSTDSDSEDDTPPEPSPLPLTRPQDVEGGIKYDTVKIVWSPRNRHPSPQNVRNAMVQFSELVKGVRDTWKARSEALKAAENQNLEDKIPAIKKDVILQRRLLDLIVNTSLEQGHPASIRRFGEHPIIVSAFYSFLLDRHTAADSDGPLTVDILKLMAKFLTMDQGMLEKTKNDKILARFVKKGGNTIKPLAQTILANAAAVTKKKAEASKSLSKENSPANGVAPKGTNPATTSNGVSDTASGIKRIREVEANKAPAAKRVISPGVKNALKPVTAPATQSKKLTAPSSAGLPVKPRANIIASKRAPSLFTSLMSASKRPGTSNAARAAAAAVAAKEQATAASEKKDTPRAAAPKPMFSFSETMADLSKPKETPSATPVEDGPPETEEERNKRLRKEERRKLRVKWKPDDSLTEVRLFTHDPEEEIGHDTSMMRDVDDVGGEGRMLKMHRGVDDLEEEEDGGWNEETMFPYTNVSAIDFDDFDPEERKRNFLKTAGSQTPDSPEKAAQDQREANTLSVFYTSPADIPFSPKEPPPPEPDEPYEPEVIFGEPDHSVLAKSNRYFDARAPPPPPPKSQTPPNPSPQVDISSVLKALQQNQPPQQPQQPQPPQPQPQQPAMQSSAPDLQSIFAQFSTQPQVQSIPQPPQVPQAPASQGLDIQKLLAVMNAQKQMQQATAFPQMQASQPPNLAAILSQLSNPGMQQPQQQQFNQMQQFGQQNPFFEDRDRKRNREGASGYDGEDSSYNYNKRPRSNGDSNKAKKHPKAGLVPCRYWKEGKCLKGDDCTFRHDPLD